MRLQTPEEILCNLSQTTWITRMQHTVRLYNSSFCLKAMQVFADQQVYRAEAIAERDLYELYRMVTLSIELLIISDIPTYKKIAFQSLKDDYALLRTVRIAEVK